MPGKRKRRDRSPSLSSDSKENIDFDENDNGSGSEDSLDFDNNDSSFVNTQDKSDYIECGTIKSLKLINFMCHAHFVIDFGPRINFVIGRNGSGKSAILTAIVLVLGGRASNTSRGQSFKSFIKTGESRAKITVKLNNHNGCDQTSSFKFDVYGDTIIVERSLKADGTSTYSVKNKSGKLISNKKAELDAIIKHFNIQIDNPIVVLNQEVSRNFLNSKNPRDKYNFFMKATQLEDILNDYAYASEKTTLTEIELDKKKKVLSDVAAELKELKKKVNLFAKIDDQANKLEALDYELSWAIVKEKESEIESFKKNIESGDARADDIKADIEKYTTKLQQICNEKEELKAGIENLRKTTEEIKRKIETEVHGVDELKAKKNQITTEVSKFKIVVDQIKRDEECLEQKIKELKKQFGDQEKVEKEKKIRFELISKLEEEDKQINAELKTRKLHKSQLLGSIQEMERKVREAKYELDSIRTHISRKRQEIENARSSETNQLLRFGSYMPALRKQIDKAYAEKRFRHKPLGPIGSLIKLKDPNAALAVESCIKGLVSAFCCDNQDDAKVLTQIFRYVLGNSRPPMIVTRKFTSRHNVSRNGLQSDNYSSILELLDIEQDPVANVLIDRANIESVVYIANENEALSVMTDPDKVPMNCNQAYTRTGTNMYPVKENQFFKSYAPLHNQAKYLIRDLSDYIESLAVEVKDNEKKLRVKELELPSLDKTLRENKSDYDETSSKLVKLSNRLAEIGRELEELRNVEELTPYEISVFEDELASLQTKKVKATEEFNSVRKEYEMCKTAIHEAEEKITTYQEERRRKIHEERPLKEKLYSLDEKIDNLKKNLDKLQAQLNNVTSDLTSLEAKMSSLTEELTTLKQNTLEKTGTELRTKRPSEDVKKEILEIKRFMKEQEKEIGDREKITKQYHDRIEAHEKVLEQVETFEELLAEFKSATKMRLEKYKKLRKKITEKACQVFKLALDELNFSGILEINHDDRIVDGATKKAKTLEIKINPKVLVSSDAYKDTRSLSGGERSYGTVAFLVALWESCNSPFRILDEVDVFMDVVTRSTAMQILVENAKLKHGKQYIFLSPLGLVVDEKYVHVHRMPDPIRGLTNAASSDA